jgi:AcrR family transcriptional regulator
MAKPNGTEVSSRRPVSRQAPVQADEIVDAAERCFARFGVERTTMGDVAREAKVHRATVYRRFAERNDLIVAVLLKRSRPVIQRAANRVAGGADASSAVVESLVSSIDDALGDEQLVALFTSSSAAVTAQLASLDSEFFRLALEVTRPVLEQAKVAGELREGIDPEDAVRWLLRISLSFLTSEPRLDPAEQRRLLRTYVTPAIFSKGSA